MTLLVCAKLSWMSSVFGGVNYSELVVACLEITSPWPFGYPTRSDKGQYYNIKLTKVNKLLNSSPSAAFLETWPL